MYCSKCGQLISDNAKFCSNCGAAVEIENKKPAEYTSENPIKTKTIPALKTDTTVTDTTKPDAKVVEKQSGLGIIAFIFTLTIILAIPGAILAFIDIVRCNPNKKHGLSVAALIIGLSYLTIWGLYKISNTDTNTEPNASASALVDTDEESQESYTPEEYRKACIEISYDDLMRNPDKYEGQLIKVTIEIQQVLDNYLNDEAWRGETETSPGLYWGDEYYVYDKREDKTFNIIEDDIVTVYGEYAGLKEVTRALMRTTDEVPCINAVLVDKYDEKQAKEEFSKGIIKYITVEDYSVNSKYNHSTYLVLDNTSEYDIAVTANIKFYDKDNNLVGADNESTSPIQAGSKGIIIAHQDDDFDHVTYELQYSKYNSYGKAAANDISYSVESSGKKLIITATNIGDKELNYPKCRALFFKDGNVVDYDWGYLTSNGDLAVGDSTIFEIESDKSFDDYILVMEATKSKD